MEVVQGLSNFVVYQDGEDVEDEKRVSWEETIVG